jgi:hypothetical protein
MRCAQLAVKPIVKVKFNTLDDDLVSGSRVSGGFQRYSSGRAVPHKVILGGRAGQTLREKQRAVFERFPRQRVDPDLVANRPDSHSLVSCPDGRHSRRGKQQKEKSNTARNQ